MLVWDLESDGLLDELTKIHCINVLDRSTGKLSSFNPGVYADGSPAPCDGSIEDGLKLLSAADWFGGHNLIGFDIPAVLKVYPDWTYRARVFDTLPAVNVIHTTIKDSDFAALARGRLTEEFRKSGLIGRQSLEAWGFRLGVLKETFSGNADKAEKWADFTPEMDKYARQDPVVSLALIEHCERKNYARECLDLEMDVYRIIKRQERVGFGFNVEKAEALAVTLRKRLADLAADLQKTFPPWTVQLPDFIPKRDNKTKGWKAGVPVPKSKTVVFNPSSRQHIADRLAALRGWKPTKFTENGIPAVDETVLGELPWPEAKLLAAHFLVEKRLGQIADGQKACLKCVENGRIYGTVRSNGAVTGRMTHNDPNVAQTPAVTVEYGREFRDCYEAGPGKVLVGCDAEGLELRCLGHYMARYDGGAYAEAVVKGSKDAGTDVHTLNQKALGFNSRDPHAKRFIYALLYGAGDYKLGTIVYDDFEDETRTRFNDRFPAAKKNARAKAITDLGKTRRARLMGNLPALDQFLQAVKSAAKRGYLIGLDGRHIHVRSEHAAPNSLLQSAGAVIMKKALVLLDAELNVTYRCAGGVVEFVANIHDEVQIETTPEDADGVGRLAADSIRLAGEHFKFRCPLSGSYKVGRTWAETH